MKEIKHNNKSIIKDKIIFLSFIISENDLRHLVISHIPLRIGSEHISRHNENKFICISILIKNLDRHKQI